MNIIEYPVLHKSKRKYSDFIGAIVLHDTGGKTAQGTLAWFNNPRSLVSSHYLIEKDGTIYQCVPDEEKAWHAGRSELFGVPDVNEFSIGIELVDDDDENVYPEDQMRALVELCAELVGKYEIPLHQIVGHEHICVPPGRKVDPGSDFDWFLFLLNVAEFVLKKRI